MIGLVYLKGNKRIILRIDGVTSCTSTDVIGLTGTARGIDLSVADFVVVGDTSQQPGETLGTYSDLRGSIPPGPEEQIRRLQETVAELQSQLGGQ